MTKTVLDTSGDKLEGSSFMSMDRRTFLKMVEVLGASLFLNRYHVEIAKALELSETRIVWVQGAECTGCSESVINASVPDIFQAIEKLNLNIRYHELLLGQQGIFVDGKLANTSELNSEILFEEVTEKPDYILVAEGAIANGPDGTGKYCIVGGRPYKEIFKQAAENAQFIVAVGQCATHGGVNSAKSDIVDIMDYRGVAFTMEDDKKGILNELGIDKPVINLNGCPVHPDWVLLTLAAVILGKIRVPDDLPEVLDKWHRPKVFFPEDHTIHENCPRRGYYDRGEFDDTISGDKCLWKLGCKAPYTHADCAIRRWNAYHSFCPQSGSPCIACVSPGFPDSSRPFFQEAEDRGILLGTNIDTIAVVAIGAAIVAAGAHAIRRMKKDDNNKNDTQKKEGGDE